MAQQTLEEIKQLAERMWEGCHGCDETDKQMWTNGYITGALSNQIELPSDEEIEKAGWDYELNKIGDGYNHHFIEGAKWYREQLKKKLL